MQKGFTLIEMVIVLVIVSVLMTITMRFGSNRINDLKYQSSKEQFVSAYARLYSESLSSNYHLGTRFDTLHLYLALNNKQLTYSFDSGTVSIPDNSPSFSLSGLQLDSGSIEKATIVMKPYTLGCTLLNEKTTGEILAFTLIIENKKSYCFEISNDTCKLIEKNCK